jgi:hypothetical protein
LVYWPTLGSLFVNLTDGYFLVYRNPELNAAVLRWNDREGNVIQTDTSEFNLIVYAYANGNDVYLIERVDAFVGPRVNISLNLHHLNFFGELISSDTLQSELLDLGELVSGVAVEYQDGVLTTLIASVVPGTPRNDYRIWLTKWNGTELTHFTPFDPGPFPNESYAFAWQVHRTTWDRSVIAFFLNGGNTNRLWFMGIESDGFPSSLLYDVEIDETQNVNGIAIAEANGSMYAAITEISDNLDPGAGCNVLAFPVDAILASPRTPQVPSEFSLSAYPNPFNGATGISFTTSRDSKSQLRIYDVTGREVFVSELTETSGAIAWSPSGIATGNFFVQLSSGNQSLVRRVTYLK